MGGSHNCRPPSTATRRNKLLPLCSWFRYGSYEISDYVYTSIGTCADGKQNDCCCCSCCSILFVVPNNFGPPCTVIIASTTLVPIKFMPFRWTSRIMYTLVIFAAACFWVRKKHRIQKKVWLLLLSTCKTWSEFFCSYFSRIKCCLSVSLFVTLFQLWACVCHGWPIWRPYNPFALSLGLGDTLCIVGTLNLIDLFHTGCRLGPVWNVNI